jgi:asparagine synthase (glutamine-hydrolysing)
MCGIWATIQQIEQCSNQRISSKETNQKDILFSSFMTIQDRGPENFSIQMIQQNLYLGFHRLAINGLSGSGNQPFVKETSISFPVMYQQNKEKKHTIYTVCNGEIYNYKQIIENNEFDLQGKSDCEVLPFLYMKYKEDMIRYLDGEFAFIMFIVNNETQEYTMFCGRDPFGVRPLFYGTKDDNLYLGSELKSIVHLSDQVNVFPPGHTMTFSPSNTLYKNYHCPNYLSKPILNDVSIIYEKIRNTFTTSVKKRLSSERPIGCLLSGGLDSSIVSAITASLSEYPLHTFTIGLEGATDIEYAEKVSKHIGTIHTTFIITIEEALDAIEKVIYTIESYDCTTVRASVWQYLLGKKIRKDSDIKVLLTGEGSDELMSGYMYFHKAPNEMESHLENIRLLEDIHRFDGLRVDRAMSCHGLEVRIPFLDPEFVELYLSLPKSLRVAGKERMEKQLFRDAFRDTNFLPSEVLYRRKEAFSDGTSTNEKSWFQIIQAHIENIVLDEEFKNHKYGESVDTKEKYYYKKIFEKHFGCKSFQVIPYYWLPKWCGNITEPSARVLDVYIV